MTQYNALNVKLSNLQLNKLKSGIKIVTLTTSLNNVHDQMMKIIFRISCY